MQKKERALISYTEYMGKQRFPLNIKQIKDFAWAIALKSEREKNNFLRLVHRRSGGEVSRVDTRM